jgi:hypothetical protein
MQLNKQILILATAVAAVMTVGCKTITGNLVVESDFTIKGEEKKSSWDEGEDWWNHQDEVLAISLNRGQYDLSLDFTSRKSLTMNLKGQGKKAKLDLTLPRELPSYVGHIELSAADLKQEFGLIADVDTEVTLSDDYWGVESCTYSRTEWVCRRNQDYKKEQQRERAGRRAPPGRNNEICEKKIVTHVGQQEVEYHYKNSTTTTKLQFVSSEQAQLLGNFVGYSHESDKIYTYQGLCR